MNTPMPWVMSAGVLGGRGVGTNFVVIKIALGVLRLAFATLRFVLCGAALFFLRAASRVGNLAAYGVLIVPGSSAA